jgi:hypothetical protein
VKETGRRTLTIPARLPGSQLLSRYCPRCSWINLHFQNRLPFQVPFPGIFNSVDKHTKNVIHAHFDRYGKLPDWFPPIGEVEGYVPSRSLHQSKFSYEDPTTGIVLRGTPDDVFRIAGGSFHIVDHKTAKASEAQQELLPLYQAQLNVYADLGDRLKRFPSVKLSLIYIIRSLRPKGRRANGQSSCPKRIRAAIRGDAEGSRLPGGEARPGAAAKGASCL